MILIADAGGSKTDWRFIDSDQKINQFRTSGFNIRHKRLSDFLTSVGSELPTDGHLSEIHFYVAGFHSSYSRQIAEDFNKLYPTADVFGYSDMLGAARSLCGNNRGWAGVLGTGANMAHYDGRNIEVHVPPLGYLLGDEGSGAWIGREFLTAYLRRQMPSLIKKKLEESTSISYEEVLDKTYNGSGVKHYWASFLPFLNENIGDEWVYSLIYRSFLKHFEVFFPETTDEPLHYTGSVAYHFSSVLRQAAIDSKLSIGIISESPIAGLALYHQPE